MCSWHSLFLLDIYMALRTILVSSTYCIFYSDTYVILLLLFLNEVARWSKLIECNSAYEHLQAFRVYFESETIHAKLPRGKMRIRVTKSTFDQDRDDVVDIASGYENLLHDRSSDLCFVWLRTPVLISIRFDINYCKSFCSAVMISIWWKKRQHFWN